MNNKENLIELYNQVIVLGSYIELEKYARYPITAMHPGKTPETLTEEELITLITASVTNMTGQVC
ncbi:hypothetical protein AABV78_004491 [Enterobacter hormaechei]|uniref:hypothetical protein n=1 Tax=Enterobacteriaceae TaxID=543 RepID=UPI000F839E2B|nr:MULTISPECIES: hypothetical protein [Enterobacteriaceae]EKY3884973.1 hypothetical protein [Enterobacter hormaechei]EKY3887316.1 hypothetical protein [Enterobacter hormaechei]MDE7606862.1 hypothetical protein [Enterobacter hormaechei]RTO74269.1 hypothetical protein EKN63_00245 [Enterobacter hormaechei]